MKEAIRVLVFCADAALGAAFGFIRTLGEMLLETNKSEKTGNRSSRPAGGQEWEITIRPKRRKRWK